MRTPAQATTPSRAPLVASGGADVMVGAGTMGTTLYRFFDAQDRLLYVGIAGRPAGRAHQHSKKKEWWTEVTHSTYEHFTTREAAAAAEVAAIVTEQPVYNVVHNGPNKRVPLIVEFTCVVCDQCIRHGAGYIQVDAGFALTMYRTYGDPDNLIPQDAEALAYLNELISEGGHAKWESLHRDCDPDPHGPHYWWAVERLRTNDDLIRFEAHIIEKNWGLFTDVENFVDIHFMYGLAAR